MCVTFAGKGEMAAAAKLFDLLLLALKEKWSTRAQQSGAGTATLELRGGRKEKLYQHGKDAIIFTVFRFVIKSKTM